MITAQAEVQIDRPVEEVFAFLADARNEPRWLPGAAGVEKVTEGPVGQGTRFRGQYARIGTVTLDIVAYDAPRQVTFRGRGQGMEFDDAITLAPMPDGTLLRASMRAHPHGLLRLLSPLVGRVMRQQFRTNWGKLKDILERPVAVPQRESAEGRA